MKSRKEVVLEAQREERTVHFATLMDLCHLKKCRVGTKSSKKYKGRVVVRADIVKDDSGSLCCIHRTGFVCVTTDGSKSNECHSKATRKCKTSSRRSISLHSRKNETVPKLHNIPKSECPVFVHTFHDSSGPNHGQTSKTPWYLSNDICTDTRLLASCGKDNLKWSIGTGMRKSTELGMSICSSKTRTIPVSMDDIKVAGQKQNVAPTWKK